MLAKVSQEWNYRRDIRCVMGLAYILETCIVFHVKFVIQKYTRYRSNRYIYVFVPFIFNHPVDF